MTDTPAEIAMSLSPHQRAIITGQAPAGLREAAAFCALRLIDTTGAFTDLGKRVADLIRSAGNA